MVAQGWEADCVARCKDNRDCKSNHRIQTLGQHSGRLDVTSTYIRDTLRCILCTDVPGHAIFEGDEELNYAAWEIVKQESSSWVEGACSGKCGSGS